MSVKKGDLEVSIIEACNFGVLKGHALYCSLEIKTQRNTSLSRVYYTTASQDAKWNQTISLSLLRLEGEELLVQVWCKRHLKKDLFMGQFLIRISALNLAKEAQWQQLTDKTENSKGESPAKKKESQLITGEVLCKLNFIHRLVSPRNSLTLSPPATPTENRRASGTISPRAYSTFVATISAKTGERYMTPSSPNSLNSPYFDENFFDNKEGALDGDSREKLLSKGKEPATVSGLVRTTQQVPKLEISEPISPRDKLEQIKQNMGEVEKIVGKDTLNARPRSVPYGSIVSRREHAKVPPLLLLPKSRESPRKPSTPKEFESKTPPAGFNLERFLAPKAQQVEMSGNMELALAYYQVIANESEDSSARDSVTRLRQSLKDSDEEVEVKVNGLKDTRANQEKYIQELESKLYRAQNEIATLKEKLEQANPNINTIM